MNTEPERDCSICPRLLAFRENNKQKFLCGFNGAVPSFGNLETAKLIIVGLAPGLKGANLSGRPFTGDYAGELLYSSLLKFGLANGAYASRSDDGLILNNTLITNAVRCVPPDNKPTGEEINSCNLFLKNTLQGAPKLKVIIALGKIAHDSCIRAQGLKLKDFPFLHGAVYKVTPDIVMISSYHCSRYNTNTKRLTTAMFENIFYQALQALKN